MRRVFVHFLEESSARKKRFEIIWPLAEVLKSFQNLLVKKISREIVGALSPTGKKKYEAIFKSVACL